MEFDDPFPRVLKVDRLFAEERPGTVAEPQPPTAEELRELARPVQMPPLTYHEEDAPPARRLDAAPDPYLDDPAVSEATKGADTAVGTKFLDEHQTTLLRPWDEPDTAEEKPEPRRNTGARRASVPGAGAGRGKKAGR